MQHVQCSWNWQNGNSTMQMTDGVGEVLLHTRKHTKGREGERHRPRNTIIIYYLKKK